MTTYPASELFGGQPPHLIDRASDVGAWFVDPPGVITQLGKKSVIDPTVVTFLTTTLHAEVCRRSRRRDDLRVLHDWSCLTGYDPNARTELTEWCLRNRGAFSVAAIVRPPVRPLLDIALSMATSALADAGMRLRIYTTLEQGFKEMNVRVLPPLNQSEL